DLFAVLLGVNGIGPKGALAVLSVYSPEAFRKALVTEDLDALTLIPGVGKKTAARMILELREKLALPELEVVPGGNGARRAVLVEVKGALLNLGYTPAEARSALESLPEADDSTVEDMLKRALKELVRGARRSWLRALRPMKSSSRRRSGRAGSRSSSGRSRWSDGSGWSSKLHATVGRV